jgi:hypothetical protein
VDTRAGQEAVAKKYSLLLGIGSWTSILSSNYCMAMNIMCGIGDSIAQSVK